MKNLWVEKYRPKSISEYVFKNEKQKGQIQSWLNAKIPPHSLMVGSPGVGKTTLAKVLINEFEVDWGDVLEINASNENGVDVIREKITRFCSTIPFGDFKIILLDEADFISPAGQAALRGVMEQYANGVRFILTANYGNRIIPAIHSRCQTLTIDSLDMVEFTARMAQILIAEEIDFDLDVLDTFVKATYPDLRKCINTCQMNSSNGKLSQAEAQASDSADYRIEMVNLFKKGKIKAARELICDRARPEEYEDIFVFMYKNLDLWSKKAEGQDEAILIIRNALVKHSMVACPEINMAACLVELASINV